MATGTPDQRAAARVDDVHVRRGRQAFRRLNGQAFDEAIQRIEHALDTKQIIRASDVLEGGR